MSNNLKLMNHIIGIICSILFVRTISSYDTAINIMIGINVVLLFIGVYSIYTINKTKKSKKQIKNLVWARFILVLLVHFVLYGNILFTYMFFIEKALAKETIIFGIFFITNLIIICIILHHLAKKAYFELLAICCSYKYGVPKSGEEAQNCLMNFVTTYETNFIKRYLNIINTIPEEYKMLGYLYDTIPHFFKLEEKGMIHKMKTRKRNKDENNNSY